jgi:hypothetical protein
MPFVFVLAFLSAILSVVPAVAVTISAGGYSGVSSDLFDIGQGNTVVEASPGITAASSMFGLTHSLPGDPNNVLFADNASGGFVHTVLFQLPSVVQLGSIRIGFSQDGLQTRRGAAGYTLLGLQSLTDSGVVLSQATFASDYVTAYGDNNIVVDDVFPSFSGRYFRFNVVQRADSFGPRVTELDGFVAPVPEPSALVSCLAGLAFGAFSIARRHKRA